MTTVDRIAERLSVTGERLLVLYLTLGDPVSESIDLAATVKAGVDVLEFGIPTPGTHPRGTVMAESFDRARSYTPDQSWDRLRELRDTIPDTPILLLVYPHSVTDLGGDEIIKRAIESDVDGTVLTDPEGQLTASEVAAAGLSAIPLLLPGTDPQQRRRLENYAQHLTYQALADRTGTPLDPAQAGRLAAETALGMRKPFLAGFGIRDEHDIRAVAGHAAGVVIGSALYQGLAATEPDKRTAWTSDAVRRWKAATILSGTGSRHAR